MRIIKIKVVKSLKGFYCLFERILMKVTEVKNYLKETKIIIDQLNLEDINKIVQCITATRRKKGRIFRKRKEK